MDVVHHPREGACVLRYHFPGDVGDDVTPATYYAKVYGNGVGEVTHRVLRSLDGGDPPDEGTSTRFPRAVAYSPPGRLLVTEELPGRALVPLLLKGAPDEPARASERRSSELRAAVRASGEALATMHAQTRPRARLHTVAEELAGLDREMQVVSGVWPEVAERVRRHLDALSVPSSERGGFVLSHGDFTPSQVLLGADQVVGRRPGHAVLGRARARPRPVPGAPPAARRHTYRRARGSADRGAGCGVPVRLRRGRGRGGSRPRRTPARLLDRDHAGPHRSARLPPAQGRPPGDGFRPARRCRSR